MPKKTVATLQKMKQDQIPITMLTAYDYTMASLMDAAGIDTLLVGDSLGMTMQGYESTLPVTMDEMIVYGRSVVKGAKESFVIIDMPFMSYQISPQQALENAGRLVKETGCQAVKLEGGTDVADQIRAIVDAGIPVCGHIGMTPQSVNAFGGFKVQGKSEAQAIQLVEDVLAVQNAGAFMVVLECVPNDLAELLAKKASIVTIGIGAGDKCDGQVLVYQDMLGMTEQAPKFVKVFGTIGADMKKAFQEYSTEVKSHEFPNASQGYGSGDVSLEFLKELDERYPNPLS